MTTNDSLSVTAILQHKLKIVVALRSLWALGPAGRNRLWMTSLVSRDTGLVDYFDHISNRRRNTCSTACQHWTSYNIFQIRLAARTADYHLAGRYGIVSFTASGHTEQLTQEAI